MDGLDFFQRHSRLKRPSTALPHGEDVCPHCWRLKKLYRKAGFIACDACAPIKLAYAYGKDKFTLSNSDFAIVSATTSVFYSNLLLQGPKLEPGLKSDGMYELLYRMIKNPPSSEYLLIHFGKPTNTRGSFRLNPGKTSDFVHVSGETTIGGRNISAINAWLVRDLLFRFPNVSSEDWNTIIGLDGDLHNPMRGEAAALQWEDYDQQFPGIFTRLPEPKSVEHKILEVIAPHVDRIRSKTARKTTSRRKRSA